MKIKDWVGDNEPERQGEGHDPFLVIVLILAVIIGGLGVYMLLMPA